MYNKLVISSGTGFLGKVIINRFSNEFKEIVILTRNPIANRKNIRYVYWEGKNFGEWIKELKDADVLINLTGKSVDCRYNEKNKKEIIDSRIDATKILSKALISQGIKIPLWINASSATIYESSYDKANTEDSGIIGDDFSMNVCKKWESTFFETTDDAIKKVALRISIVFGNEGGVYPVLRKLCKLGIGGKQANGKQMVSWIHTYDFTEFLNWIIKHPNPEKIYNCCAPTPLSNREMMAHFRKKFKPLFSVSQSTWMLKLGAVLLRTEPELVLKSRFVVPAKAIKEGFKFKHEKFEAMLEDLY